MMLTPDEAIKKNQGNAPSQLDRATRDLAAEIEAALEHYTGDPMYVGVPAYLQYRVDADVAKKVGPVTLEVVDRALHERFGPYGWKIGFVSNPPDSCCWAKVIDARKT